MVPLIWLLPVRFQEMHQKIIDAVHNNVKELKVSEVIKVSLCDYPHLCKLFMLFHCSCLSCFVFYLGFYSRFKQIFSFIDCYLSVFFSALFFCFIF